MPYLKSSQITGLSPKPLDVTGFTQSASEHLEGTYSQHEVLLADAFTITDDVTISDNLILAKLSDDGNAITVTGDASTTRTIAGSGSLEGSTFAQTPNVSLTGMTGVIGSAITGGAGLTGSTSLGIVTTGTYNATIGSSATLNHDAQKYSWSRYIDSDTNYSSDATLDFQQAHYMGSGVTEAGGIITIGAGGGGLYLVSACTHNHTNTAGHHQWSFKVNATEIANPSQYANWNSTNSTDYYMTAGTVIIPVPLDAGDTIQIYGKAYVTSNPDTSFFNGVRIGAKT